MEPIYHIAPQAELRAGVAAGQYAPARFAEDGFVHCTATPAAVLAVARDYFSGTTEPLLVLRIDPSRLTARLVYEAPAPLPGGSEHLRSGELFPHVYGRIDLAAIDGVGDLERRGGEFVWPARFAPLADRL